jgi:ribonuclease Z
MPFIVTVLGSSSALPTSTRFPTAQVLNVHERFFLIDCGEGTQIQLRRNGINMSKINHIFISHLHGDHVFGLFGLLSSYNLLGRKSDLHIYAHKNLNDTIEHYKKYFGVDLSYEIIFHSLHSSRSEIIFADKHMTVQTIPLRHSLPVTGFIFRERQKKLNIRKEAIEKFKLGVRDIRRIKDGHDFITPDGINISNVDLTYPPFRPRSYAFCTDTAFFTKLTKQLTDIDMLYFEATFSDKDKKLAKLTGHSTSKQAAYLAKSINTKKLLIGHFSTRYKNINLLVDEARSVFPETYAVEDGEDYPVELQREILQK